MRAAARRSPPLGRGGQLCCRRKKCAIWRSAGSRRWRRWFAMRRNRAPAAAPPPTCRWWRSRKPRSSAWSERMHVEDILPLSPLQEGLLFHAHYDARAPDVYTVQLVLTLQGPLDKEALAAAVLALVERHAILRAGFRHENLSRPVQVILRRVAPPWHSIDLSLLDAAGREQRLADILAQDRAERFDLGSPPLIRFALIRLAADEHRLVLTNHHIVMDGWSLLVLVQELLTLYAHKGDGRALPRVTPYRDFLAWIAGQDRVAATAAWREALAGLEQGARLAPHQPGRVPITPEKITLELSEPMTAALTRQART